MNLVTVETLRVIVLRNVSSWAKHCYF